MISSLLSKAARRKRREEAEKVPEVSKEIFYDVSCDLKAAFGQKKDGPPEEEEVNWDQTVEAEEEKLPDSVQPAEKEPSSGFQFSFFGDVAEAGGEEAGGSAVPTGHLTKKSPPKNADLDVGLSVCRQSTKWRASPRRGRRGNRTRSSATAARRRTRKRPRTRESRAALPPRP